MNAWTEGYVADINYTHGYYNELDPARVSMAFTNAGLETPKTGVACELGFGHGLSTNIHAAATVTEWHGTDFNPAQTAFARELAEVSGNGAQLFDQAFAEFCKRDDLPEFDFICLHGIWSWISHDNQAVIVDFVRRKLKVGGVLYISYNCLPGWAPMVPVRDLLTQYADSMTAPGIGLPQRIDSALDFADKLLETNASYFAAYPRVGERLKSLRSQHRNYLVHEYFNRNWEPTNFTSMAKLLGEAKLTFACSAHYPDHIAAVNLTPQQTEILAGIQDPIFQQSVRDIMVNQNFRRDYWVKGARHITPLQRVEAMRRPRVVLITPPKNIEMKLAGSLIEGSLSEEVYAPLIAILADFKPHTIGELELALHDKQLSLQQIFEAALILIGKGNLMLAQEPDDIAFATEHSQRLNLALFEHARGSEDIKYVASPVTGAGLQAPRLTQLFLLAHTQGKRGVAALSDFVWGLLASQGQRMVREGKTLETTEENTAEVRKLAEKFDNDYLPMYRALGVIS